MKRYRSQIKELNDRIERSDVGLANYQCHEETERRGSSNDGDLGWGCLIN